MLPMFAAMVCPVTTGTSISDRPAFVRVRIAKGTKMISDTSFVISIELKKQLNTNSRASIRLEGPRSMRRTKPQVNMPLSRNPATIAMRQNNKSKSAPFTLASMASSEKGAAAPAPSAKIIANARSGFFFK